MFRAFAKFHERFPDYLLTVYGKGELLEELEDLIAQLGIGEVACIKPYVSAIHERILKCAMFVSTSDYEGISNSMLESMGIGLPCICTDCPVGGARMFIKDKTNGLLIPVDNEQALIEAMSSLAGDPSFANAMGANATSLKTELEVGKISKMWMDVINSF